MLEQAMARFQADVAKLSGIGLGRYRGPVMHIECRTEGASLATVPVDEGYRLSITATEVRLVAAGPAGVLRGLATVSVNPLLS
jgi:hexosaminidase